MTYKLLVKTAALLGAVAGPWLLGCGEPAIPSCLAEDEICGVCPGVPNSPVCGEETCTEGVTCAAVVAVGSNAELQSKATAASAGDCLALAPGEYGAVTLPGGVSLLGPSAAEVTVASITLSAGAGAVVRGLAVGSGGIDILGATAVRIESVHVTGDPEVKRDGIALAPGSSATIVTSTIEGAGRVGVFAQDAEVTLDQCVVSNAHTAGVWIQGSQCDADCGCTGSPILAATCSALRDNHVFGLSLRGATASLADTDVTGTRTGDTEMTGQLGGGIAATACSNVSAIRLRVLDSADFGILLDGSTAKLGGDGTDETVEISRNRRGLWIQNVIENSACSMADGCVTLHHGNLAGNLGVGIGVTGSSRGVILCKSAVTDTFNAMLPVSDENGMIGGSKAVGDGVDWLDGSQVTIEELTLSGNERQSLLIDGPVSGDIQSVTLGAGEKPILQQDLPMGGTQPMPGSGVSLESQADRKVAVPRPLSVPSAL